MVTVVPVVIGTLGAMIPKLGEWLQQIPGRTEEHSPRNAGSSSSQASGRRPELEGHELEGSRAYDLDPSSSGLLPEAT